MLWLFVHMVKKKGNIILSVAHSILERIEKTLKKQMHFQEEYFSHHNNQ